ncbi:MAG: hypothetical protein KDK91_19445 [Gammaproteobacteria bacterium]|nr:hypothetical protein [Gammaproteobacteria bacterium]
MHTAATQLPTASGLRLIAQAFDNGGGAASAGVSQLRASSIGESVVGRSGDGDFTLVSGFGAVFVQTFGDADGDGLNGAQEAVLGTHPGRIDSDFDGLTDLEEVNRDGNPNDYNIGIDTDPLNPDTDGDGLVDGKDLDPLNAPLPVPMLPIAALACWAGLLYQVRRLVLARHRTQRKR